jgi:hypothetical protein
VHVVAEIDAFRGRQNLVAIPERAQALSRRPAPRSSAWARPGSNDCAAVATGARRFERVVDGILDGRSFGNSAPVAALGVRRF